MALTKADLMQKLDKGSLTVPQFGDDDIPALQPMLKSVHWLDLTHSHLTDEGAGALATMLEANKHLTCLLYGDSEDVSAESVAKISDALVRSENKNLIHVFPETDDLHELCEENRRYALRLAKRIVEHSAHLSSGELKRISELTPAIVTMMSMGITSPEYEGVMGGLGMSEEEILRAFERIEERARQNGTPVRVPGYVQPGHKL